MDHHAIGLIEVNSIAKGYEVCDVMAKTADVTILVAKSICPGKYIIMIGGDVAAVRQSVCGAAGGVTGMLLAKSSKKALGLVRRGASTVLNHGTALPCE